MNSSALAQNPIREIISAYTNSPIGDFFFAVFFIFIIGAVYVKTRNMTSTMAMMAIIGTLFSSVLTASGAGIAVLAMFYVFTGVGIAGLVASVFLK